MLVRLGVALLSVSLGLPAFARTPSAKVEGAGPPRMLKLPTGPAPVWELHPGGAATLLLEGPARVTVFLRVAGSRPARVRALVSYHHRHRRLEPPRHADRHAHLSGYRFVSASARTTIRLGRGRQWVTVAWPHHTRAVGLVGFAGVDLGIRPKARPKAKIPLAGLVPPKAKPEAKATPKATPKIPLAGLVPPKAEAKAAPKAKATPKIPLAGLVPPKPTPKAKPEATPKPKPLAEATPPPKGYERIRAYGDQTPAPPSAPPMAEASAGPRKTFTLTPWVGAYIPLYKLSVGPAAGITAALDLGPTLGIHLGDTRLALRLDLGWTRVIESGPTIVPGRGLDAGFTQDSHLVPASLGLAWHLAPSASVRPFILAGIGTVWTATHFIAFSAPVNDRVFGLLGVFGAGAGIAAGPGELGLEALVDVAGVNLGPLGPVGETTITGVRIDARYAFRF